MTSAKINLNMYDKVTMGYRKYRYEYIQPLEQGGETVWLVGKVWCEKKTSKKSLSQAMSDLKV